MKSIYKWLLPVIACCLALTVGARCAEDPQLLKVGYSIALNLLTPEKLVYAKANGIDYIEVSFGGLIDEGRHFNLSDEQMLQKVRNVRQWADAAGIKIWSVHMPFGKTIDLSLTEETERRQVVALHRKVLSFVRELHPQIVLFHPSFYLSPNERQKHKSQMIRSARELHKAVRKLKATMVVENMLGPELQAPGGRERPLCRTVEEMMEIMNRLPGSIYAAVDMNHIKHPERLIRALGPRLHSVHVADGSGEREDHFFPCSGKGANNWTDILLALEEAHYTGPFMFECKYDDVKDMAPCYQQLYRAFVSGRQQAAKP